MGKGSGPNLIRLTRTLAVPVLVPLRALLRDRAKTNNQSSVTKQRPASVERESHRVRVASDSCALALLCSYFNLSAKRAMTDTDFCIHRPRKFAARPGVV